MNLPLTGGCLCGGIRYEITQPPIIVYTCHCTDCQHITGSAFAIGVMVLDEALRLSGMPRIIESMADSGRIKGRCVCPDCATSRGLLTKVLLDHIIAVDFILFAELHIDVS